MRVHDREPIGAAAAQEADRAERDDGRDPGPRVLREAVRGPDPEGGRASEHDPQGGPGVVGE
jgi:hypothetical protein